MVVALLSCSSRTHKTACLPLEYLAAQGELGVSADVGVGVGAFAGAYVFHVCVHALTPQQDHPRMILLCL